MERTTIMLPHDLKIKALNMANKMDKSLGQFIRDSITQSLKMSQDNHFDDDPFFIDNTVYSGESPVDSAKNHDEYLYGTKCL